MLLDLPVACTRLPRQMTSSYIPRKSASYVHSSKLMWPLLVTPLCVEDTGPELPHIGVHAVSAVLQGRQAGGFPNDPRGAVRLRPLLLCKPLEASPKAVCREAAI